MRPEPNRQEVAASSKAAIYLHIKSNKIGGERNAKKQCNEELLQRRPLAFLRLTPGRRKR